jgi:hypothetical protein
MKNSRSPGLRTALAPVLACALLLVGCNEIPRDFREFKIPTVYPPLPDAPPEVTAPAGLAPPAGNRARLVLVGSGSQNFECRASGDGFEWAPTGPDARLYSNADKLVGKHYPGPTWEAEDGSKVRAHAIAQSPSKNFGSAAQLLLKVDESSSSGLFSEITYVQRLRTIGGGAPSDACDAQSIGTRRQSLYSAYYVFFSAG